ncbi:MAG: DUF1015 domain-containing protein [Bacteroidia bacterium]|nr:DUF1015 domain-containing protein [Bacteroidia bacterium]MCX7651818.1 DUF1015 domain-containing protein [Bacteroidia bacterium]MDW8417080.1 DUF1015 family protein [Bacteroidia bacterium]
MIEPFQGWVYQNTPLVCPVRDALSTTQIESLRQNPFQAIHIAYPEAQTDLAPVWQRWIAEKAIRKEPLPAFYAYSQTFYRYGRGGHSYQRVGVIGILPTDAAFLPHEAVLSERVSGIKHALSTLPVQSTPVHVLNHGRWSEIYPLLRSYLVCPEFVYGGHDGVMHRWGPIHHLVHQKQIIEAIGQGPFYIADGHHRWKAAHEAKQRYLLVYLTSMQDDTLVIAPTHRLVKVNTSPMPILSRYFILRASAARIPLWQEIQGLRHTIGIVSPEGKAFTASLLPSLWEHLENRPLVAYLHEWVLDKVATSITFSREPAQVMEAAMRGEGWAFILSELPFLYVEKAAQMGYPLPPKTTYFFPKVLSGMCFYYEGDTRISFTETASSS